MRRARCSPSCSDARLGWSCHDAGATAAPTMDDRVETEFKLRAARPIEPAAFDAAIREAGFSCRAIDSRHHVDVYLDDARHSLARAGVGLRIREDARTRVVTAKTAGHRNGALFVRAETEAPWTSI